MSIEDILPIIEPTHYYNVFSSGTDLKQKQFRTRKEAEIYMNDYCAQHGIKLECRECDKHERVYTNHNGVRFYINRI